MSRAQLTILTNICMIEDLEKQRARGYAVSIGRSNHWSGYAFPGGLVSKTERLLQVSYS